MINPIWLRSFCTLAEVGHFTRTAARLNMTQSGVSQHISKLEQQLDQALLIRHGKSFNLTDAGNDLYQQGRKILESLADLEIAIGADPADVGCVRLMSPGSIGLKLYPHLLEQQTQYPNLSLDYRFAPNHSIESAITQFNIDLGVMTQKSQLDEVICEAIGQEALLLVTSAQIHNTHWPQLQQLGFIGHPDGSHHADLLLGANFAEFKQIDQFKLRGFSNQINLILEPISRGIGFTILPAFAVEAFSQPHLIKAHRLTVPVNETIYLCYHSHRAIPNRVKLIKKHIYQSL